MNIAQARKIFNEISITELCDAAKEVRVLDANLRPLIKNPKMLGKAFTVKSHGDLLPIMKSLELATPDHVIMIDSCYAKVALGGGLFTTEAKRRNIAGIVVDGLCRDIEQIKQIGLPFYAKGSCPKAGSKNIIGEINVVIECGGVEIVPDDIVVGDENGVIVLKEKDLEETFRVALEVGKKENLALEKMRQGMSLLEMFNFKEHYDRLVEGKESSFQWKL